MEDFGDYIYLIAIAIAGISSLLRKKKPQANQLPDENGMPDLDDVIPDPDDYPSPFEEAPASYETVFTPASEITTKPFYTPMEKHEMKVPVSYETVADFMKLKAKRTVHTVVHSSMIAHEVELLEPEPEIHITLDTAEEVKRAFIYSEIFNRKY